MIDLPPLWQLVAGAVLTVVAGLLGYVCYRKNSRRK